MSSSSSPYLPIPLSSSPTNTRSFYTTYYGHPPSHLQQLAKCSGEKPIIWLLGDSTLDNKYWLPFREELHPDPSHARLLDHSLLKRDVSYWLNKLYPEYATINCAVEATTVSQRNKRLLPQDRIVSENFGENDVVVVSLGGNDVALRPSLRTVFSVLCQTYTASSLGFSHLVSLFGYAVQKYITRMLSGRRPRLVVICGLYFPDEALVPSWASFILRALRYNSHPEGLQRLIESVYEAAASTFQILGVRVVTVPFYRVMNGKDTNLYVARVEPSEQGGQAMATLLRNVIKKELEGQRQVTETGTVT
ncbi:unnamed protein product [Agarophyton chilense]